MTPTRWLLVACAFEAAMVPLAFALAWVFGLPLTDWIWWSAHDVGQGVLASGPLFLVLAWVLRSAVGPVARLRALVVTRLAPLFHGFSLADIAGLSLLAGLGEELLFRGVVQGGLAPWLGQAGALVVASVVFGAMHAITATYAVLAGLVGLYLGGLWLWSGNLLVPAVAHAVYDAGALLVLVRTAR